MKTFKKAKEIFNSQLNKSENENTFSLQEERSTSLQKIHSTTRLYKLYVYNKTLQFGLKKLNLFKASRIKKTFYKVFLRINKISIPLEKKLKILLLTKILKFDFLGEIRKKYLRKLTYNRRLKTLIESINLIFFSQIFKSKIFYLLKLRKKISYFKIEIQQFLKYLNNSKIILKGKITFRNYFLKLEDIFKKIIIEIRWSDKFISDLIKRGKLVFLIYSATFLLLLFYTLYYLPNSNSLIRNLPEVFQNNTIHNYLNFIPILYLAGFLRPKNALLFPKNAIGHLGICTIISLLHFGVDLSRGVIIDLIKAGILFTDIAFYKFFVKTQKRFHILRLLNISTSESNLQGYLYSKLFKPVLLYQIDKIDSHLYIEPVNRFITIFGYGFSIGRYEQFTGRIFFYSAPILNESGKFILHYIYLPFYLTLLIILMYNCCYYIIYNKQPYIPIITNLVKKLTPNTGNN